MNIFSGDDTTSEVYLPVGTLSWKIGNILDDQKYPNLLLLGFSIDDSESVDIRRCFDDVTHIFAFGRDVKSSVMLVEFICFLGKSCSSLGSSGGLNGFDTLHSISQDYNENRVFKSSDPMEIGIDVLKQRGFLIGMRIGGVDASRGVCTISMTFILEKEC